MLSPRKKFWLRTAIEIVIGIFLLVPLVMISLVLIIDAGFMSEDVMDFIFDSKSLNLILSVVVWPWSPVTAFDSPRWWVVSPYVFITSFFILHIIFARERFPRWSKVVRQIRPYILLLIASYFASIWSHVLRDSAFWFCKNGHFSVACESRRVFHLSSHVTSLGLCFLLLSILWFLGKKLLQMQRRKMNVTQPVGTTR